MEYSLYEPVDSLSPQPIEQMPNQFAKKSEAVRPPQPPEKNVEVPKPVVAESKWPDISEYENIQDWVYIGVAVLIVDVIIIFLVRFFPDLFGKSINLWYNRFKLSAVIGDVFIILIGFAISRYIYTEFVYPVHDWNPLYFSGLTVLVQIVHDILFYFGVIKQLPTGSNGMIDIFKEYSEGGVKVVAADSAMMLGSSFLAMVLKAAPAHVTVAVSLLTVYALPYILETKNQFSTLS